MADLKYVCCKCGTEPEMHEAVSRWNIVTQQFECEPYPYEGYCPKCKDWRDAKAVEITDPAEIIRLAVARANQEK